MKKHRELAKALLDKAEQDESLLDAVINTESVADEIFGFHAQQAVEKLLKGLLSFHEIRYGRVHNLRILMDQLADAAFPQSFQRLLRNPRRVAAYAAARSSTHAAAATPAAAGHPLFRDLKADRRSAYMERR